MKEFISAYYLLLIDIENRIATSGKGIFFVAGHRCCKETTDLDEVSGYVFFVEVARHCRGYGYGYVNRRTQRGRVLNRSVRLKSVVKAP